MGRPKGSKDSIKRKQKNQYGFSSKEIDEVKKLKNQYKSNREIQQVTGLSKSQIKKICMENNIKQINPKIIQTKKKILFENSNNEAVCGVYIITIYRDDGYQGHYIGSSTNIVGRCLRHKYLLESGDHYNKKLQIDFDNKVNIDYRIWSIEKECDLIRKESEIIREYVGLYNRWANHCVDELLPYLSVAIIKIEDKYTIESNGCWNCNYSGKDGYGKEIQITINGITKYIKPHKVSFYAQTGEYPELIRHKCNNRKCINPNHLECGSYKDNAIDTNKNKWKLFVEKWYEYNGDYVKLTEFFGYKKNYIASNGDRYYSHIKSIARRLGLVA